MQAQVKEGMNKQETKNSRGIEWTDYTWNPVGGCKHECRWTMPDGSEAICYAEAVANKFIKAYPLGFSYHYWNHTRLEEPLRLKKPAKIFLDSMSDLMGHWVPANQIEAVFDICRQAHWHTFQLLTKNPIRLYRFNIPPNVWAGFSTPPNFMFGNRLTFGQQQSKLKIDLLSIQRAKATTKWCSVEPLSWDVAPMFEDCGLDWVVVGAASNGAKKYQPDPAHVQNLLTVLDSQNIPVFFKGNLKWAPWREEFPPKHS